jgi:hypothetical protein
MWLIALLGLIATRGSAYVAKDIEPTPSKKKDIEPSLSLRPGSQPSIAHRRISLFSLLSSKPAAAAARLAALRCATTQETLFWACRHS